MGRTSPLPNRAILERLYQIERAVKTGNYEGAAKRIDRLLETHPSDPHANFRAGWLCALRGHYEVAITFLHRALTFARCPWAEALNALGAVYMRTGQYDTGLPFLAMAARAEPTNPEVWINLANWMEGNGDDDAALATLDKAARHPGNFGSPGIRWARSFLDLKRGHYQVGWANYECRWLNTEWVAARNRTFPKTSHFWYGEAIGTAPILVHFEQGQGDVVMMLRYLPWLRARLPEARILLQVQDAVVPLLRPFPALYDILQGQDEPLSDYTWHVSLMSLPHIHGTTVETIPPPLRLAA